MTQYRGLTYLRRGTFSGSAVSLRRALADRIDICDIDLLPLGRKPALVLSRIRSLMEAAREGPGGLWTKTKTWSATLQRELEHKGSIDSETPLLAIQTLAALDIPDVRYVGSAGCIGPGARAHRARKIGIPWVALGSVSLSTAMSLRPGGRRWPSRWSTVICANSPAARASSRTYTP